MSQANIGLIRRDLLQQADARALLQKIPVADLVTMAGKAADHFLNDTLPLDPESGTMQTPQQYIEQVSATTGMPFSNVRRNMLKVHGVLDKVEEVLAGLTRGLDLSVLDAGYGTVHGQMLSFFPRTDALGVVLPSNSPGVHSLWAPTTVLKMPLVLKPGSAEPWTPLRIINAWVKAGAPAGAFAYYPTDHAGGNEILRSTGRGMVFGDVGSTKRWKADGRVEVHGPGYSKVVIGPDRRGPVGAIHRRDRRVDVEQRRPLVRECVGRVGHEARGQDRRGAGQEAVDGHRREPPTIPTRCWRRLRIRKRRSASRRRSTAT